MTLKLKTPLLIAAMALALGACTNPNRLSSNDVSLSEDGLSQTGLDAASNPNSPAYFASVVGDRVLFAVDQSTLTDAGRATLDAQIQWLTSNPSYAAIIEGHADEQGTREYNLALGARRANAVQEYLVAKGIPASRLQTVTYGKERPLEVCSAESCYAKNRRAVTVLTASAGT